MKKIRGKVVGSWVPGKLMRAFQDRDRSEHEMGLRRGGLLPAVLLQVTSSVMPELWLHLILLKNSKQRFSS